MQGTERPPDDSLRIRRQRRLVAEVEQTALRLFAERGFHDVTVEEIAAATDISPRTFFRYFPSKEDVLLAPQRRRAEALWEALAGRPPQEPAVLALRNALLRMVPGDEDERASILLRSKVLTEAPEIRARDAGYHMNLIDPLITMVAVRLGVDPTTDLRPRVIVSSMLAASAVAFHMWLEGGCEGDINVMLGEAFDLMEHGLEKADERMRTASQA